MSRASGNGLVIHQSATSAGIRSQVPPWRICWDEPDGKRPPATEVRFETPGEADKWLDRNRDTLTRSS